MKSAWTLQRNDPDKTSNLEGIRSHLRYFLRSTIFLRTLFAQQAGSRMTSRPENLIRWKWRICQQHVEGRNWQQQSTRIKTSNIRQSTTLPMLKQTRSTHTHTHYKASLEIRLWVKGVSKKQGQLRYLRISLNICLDPTIWIIWAMKLCQSLAQLHKLCKNPGSRCAHA